MIINKLSNFNNLISIINFFIKRYKIVFFTIIALLFLTSVIESIGLIALLPLFEIILNDNKLVSSENYLIGVVLKIFEILNFKVGIFNLIIFVISIFLFKFLLLISTYNFISFFAAKMQSDFQKQLIYFSFDSKWSYINKKSLGMLSNTVGLEAKIIANMFQRVCTVFSGILQSLLVFFITISIDLKYSLIALLIGILIFVLFSFLTSYAKKMGQVQAKAQQNLLKKYNDILQGLKSYKASQRLQYIKYYILKHVIELKNSNFKLNFYKYLQNYSKEPVMIIIICLFLITNANSQYISNNTLIIFIILLYRILISLNLIQINYTNILSQYGYFESVNNLFKEFKNNYEISNIYKEDKKEIVFEDDIKLENIYFSYEDKYILKKFNFIIKKNSINLIYGESGSGKTTIIDLISGLITPQKGNILIDKRDLQFINLNEWRKMIEYVQQELFLINDTIKENITFGNKKIKEEEIWKVLENINAKEFVLNLPQKLEHIVGERGSLLSGGQRQRISLARSILNKPQILILDEITASLDEYNEIKIFDYLSKLKSKMTIICISHKKSLEKYADNKIYLKKL